MIVFFLISTQQTFILNAIISEGPIFNVKKWINA